MDRKYIVVESGRGMTAEELKEKINEKLYKTEYDGIKALLLEYKQITEQDNDLATTCYLCTIYEKEKAAGQATIFDKVSNTEELIERYTRLKFYVRRIDFDVMDDMEEFYQFLFINRVSSYELLTVIDFSVVNKAKVLKAIEGE